MSEASSALGIIPVLPSHNISRDVEWYEEYTGFKFLFGDDMYAGMRRDNLEIHLQFHHGDDSDPVFPSVIKIFVPDIEPYYEEFIARGTITEDRMRYDTPWNTHEFSFYDLNKNALFFVQDA